MTDDDQKAIASLTERINELERQVDKQHVTDAYLYLMITSAANTLMMMFSAVTNSMLGKKDADLKGKFDTEKAKYIENMKETRNLIWKDGNDEAT